MGGVLHRRRVDRDLIRSGPEQQLEELVKGAKDDLASEDDDRIKAATERLSEESQKIFAKVYQQAAGAQGAQGGSDGTDGAAGDEEFHQ